MARFIAAASPERSYWWYYWNDGGTFKLQFFYDQTGDGSTQTINENDQTLTTGTWYRVGVSVDVSAKTVTHYVGGSSIGAGTNTTANATSIYDGTSGLSIGRLGDIDAAQYFDGKQDDVRVWSDIRTASEMNDNQCTELVGDEAGLAAYWRLDNSLLDQTANDNDLTNVNSATFVTDVDSCWAVAETPKPRREVIGDKLDHRLDGRLCGLTSGRRGVKTNDHLQRHGVDRIRLPDNRRQRISNLSDVRIASTNLIGVAPVVQPSISLLM